MLETISSRSLGSVEASEFLQRLPHVSLSFVLSQVLSFPQKSSQSCVLPFVALVVVLLPPPLPGVASFASAPRQPASARRAGTKVRAASLVVCIRGISWSVDPEKSDERARADPSDFVAR